MVEAADTFTSADLTPELTAKVKIALLDMFSCVFESRELPFSRQAVEIARKAKGRAAGGLDGVANVIGESFSTSPGEAAFANGTMAHGLVREDMHTGSVSHLGVVVLPALLALSQDSEASGEDLLLAVVCGYEAGAVIGKALMDAENVRLHRPTGITGPIGAALGGGKLNRFGVDKWISAVGLAANATGGLNQWPHSGADDMFFHAGFSARNAVTSVELAGLGAVGSESALDGQAGLFTVLQRADRADSVNMFTANGAEILNVFHKPVGACNYAQTPCQAALRLSKEEKIDPDAIESIHVAASAAALNYPGCDHAGPFGSVLQAKMSIHYGVAAALARGTLGEGNYRNWNAPDILDLAKLTTVVEGTDFTAAYPRLQGAEVTVTLKDGTKHSRRLEDLVPATHQMIEERFRESATAVLGAEAAEELEDAVKNMETLERAGEIAALGRLRNEKVTSA